MFVFKRLAVVFAIISVAFTSGAQSEPKRLILIDGYFFDEVPVSSFSVQKMYILKTHEGAKAFGMELDKPLPEKALQFALDKACIPNAEEFVSVFDKAKAEGKGMPLQFVKDETIAVGSKFPEFSVTDINGKVWTSGDIAGKLTVLNLWFTGCGPCRAEMPELSRWKDEMPDVMFFSATYEDAKTAAPILEKEGFNWTPIVDDTVFKKYIGQSGYPMTIVIGKDGTVAHVEYGTSPLQRLELREIITQLQ